jgi:hypothetical protein
MSSRALDFWVKLQRDFSAKMKMEVMRLRKSKGVMDDELSIVVVSGALDSWILDRDVG